MLCAAHALVVVVVAAVVHALWSIIVEVCPPEVSRHARRNEPYARHSDIATLQTATRAVGIKHPLRWGDT